MKAEERGIGQINALFTFLTSALLGSVVQVIIRDTAKRESLELLKSEGSIKSISACMYCNTAAFTCRE